MVSDTVNQPPIQTSETHTPKLSMTQYRGGGWGVIVEGQRRRVTSRDWPHTVNVYVSLFILREKLFHFHFQFSFYYGAIQNRVKRLLNLIGWKIQSFCFWWQTGVTVHTLSFPVSGHFTCQWLRESQGNWLIAQ